MTDAEKSLAASRGNRNAARGLFDKRLSRVKADLSARSVSTRVKDRVQEQAFTALDHGLDIAKESKGIIAATTGAIALWFFRQPLIELVTGLLDNNGETVGEAAAEEQQKEQRS